MATEVFKHNQPAEQHRTAADPAPEIDLEIRHPYVPWRFNNFIYERNFVAAPTTVTLFRKWGGVGSGAIESEIVTMTLGVGQRTLFFDRTVELSHGESVRLVSTGAAPAGGGDLHSASIMWEEKRNAG
ncbi:MAG TPA: hypothetical protein VMZ50_14145 [Phycisphaerae bacterium]|nr:hypothetical protein [Phycisphaerae bacterium]